VLLINRKFTTPLAVFACWLVCYSPIVYGQKEVSLCEVTVKGIKPERFMVGQKIEEVDSISLAQGRFNSLSDFLQFRSPAVFKSYGAGQLATVSFRGTSANHTALLWNGINVNFPSLGLTDFSTVPVSGFDQMTFQYGSAASCVGSDAVGGSIILRSTPQFDKKAFSGSLAFRAETSENYSGQVGFRYNKNINENWKFAGKTLAYWSTFNNNFGAEPIKNRRGESYNTEPTQTKQAGLIQDFYWMKKNGNLLSLNLWFTDNDLVIQPNIEAISQTTLTKANRILASYLVGKTMLKAGYVRDITDFTLADNAKPSHTQIDRYIVKAEHDFSWIKDCSRGTNLKIGTEVSHYLGLVDGYGSNLKTENRFDIYALLRHQFSNALSTSLNLRQAYVTGFDPPFTPSFGVEYVIHQNIKRKISLPANVGLSYRVPTLNERYWVNLGNPNIKPENGFNKEIGLVWVEKNSLNTFTSLSATVFHNLINNWTYWNPSTGYRVENLQKVLSKGFEVDFELNTKLKSLQYIAKIQYAHTNSSQQKEFGAYTADILGKQLVYIPRHVVSSSSSVIYKMMTISANQTFNSARHTTFDHSGRAFPAYYLLNLVGSFHKILAEKSLDFTFYGNNITNTLYPNLKKNSMPMRSFAISLAFNF
jgi:vitamin B12 transporter